MFVALQDKLAMPWHDPVSMGMNPRSTLDEPELRIPAATEELFLHRPYDADGKPRVGAHAKPTTHDQNKLISKKFKAVPSTQVHFHSRARGVCVCVCVALVMPPRRSCGTARPP